MTIEKNLIDLESDWTLFLRKQHKMIQLVTRFFIEYLIQNLVFHVKSHVSKHVFQGLLILKSQRPMWPNLAWNETWNDTSLKKSGVYLISFVKLTDGKC